MSGDPGGHPFRSYLGNGELTGGRRRSLLLMLLISGLLAFWHLGLTPAGLSPGESGLRLAGEFFASALAPALTYQDPSVPPGAEPLLLKALRAAGNTVLFAAAALGLSLLPAVLLGFGASSAWWAGDSGDAEGRLGAVLRRTAAPALYAFARLLISFMRSVHELLWAVLFLAALGLSPFSAVLAIAIPYAGTLAKIFSEMVDEAPRRPALALRAAGASPLQVYFFALMPRALPDITAYAFYRFECALRSSAVLGFFGFPTLGYFVSASFENLHYGEVWTYLYTLAALVVLVDWWSGALRRRLTA